MANVIDVTDATFEAEVLNSDKPVLVDFWAEWCAPCRRLSPILEQMADAHSSAISLVKVDVDANREVSAKYGIISLPAIYMFVGGEVVAKTTGAKSRPQLEEEFAQFLGV